MTATTLWNFSCAKVNLCTENDISMGEIINVCISIMANFKFFRTQKYLLTQKYNNFSLPAENM